MENFLSIHLISRNEKAGVVAEGNWDSQWCCAKEILQTNVLYVVLDVEERKGFK